MLPGGAIIFVEKIGVDDSMLDSLYKNQYHGFKREQGYTDEEIHRKEQSLEGVLVPLSFEDNRSLLQSAGFDPVHSFFQWYNFVGFLAVKSL